ncbi:hypothetical protein Ddye_027920 [Dipteronia dyeriana]|uniref:Uncharacterized protein n=1 Tax=Dipteronia dyeriana TaxID=168575 RepID=A0AAD9WRW2_9ROSI|nr:hypothetical protein Ddye_027920 [Dipteronia dyeriana]
MISYTGITSLAPSFQCLEKLCSLRLEYTHLRDASLIREFEELKVLILRGSRIEQLPKGLVTMTKLKLLDISNTLFLSGIPHNLISKLSLLMELYIWNSFGDWEVEGRGGSRVSEALRKGKKAASIIYNNNNNNKLFML